MAIRKLALFTLTVSCALGLGARREGATHPLAQAHAEDVVPALAFDPDMVRPTVGSALELALAARQAGNLETARTTATAAIVGASLPEAALLRWVAAHAARDREALVEAAELLAPVADGDHPLAPWAKLAVAEWLEGADAKRALAYAEALHTPTSELETWPGRTVSERLRARLLAKLGRSDEAIAAFEALISATPDDGEYVQVLPPLADLLSTRDEPDRVRALALYRRVAAHLPETRLGRRADEAAEAMLKSLPEPLRSTLREPELEDKIARADALLESLRFEDAEGAYLALERKTGTDPVILCRVRFGHAKALLDKRARAQGSELMAKVADECAYDPDQRAWARYHAGRAFSALGKNELALAQYEALEREAPTHRLADDALFRAAKVARDMGDFEGVTTRLEVLPTRYPEGDMHARARFALAWHARSQGELTRAIEILADDRDEEAEDVQGRAGYYRARFFLEAGDKRSAAEGFAHVFEQHPLAYYGQQAYARLLGLDPARAAELRGRLSHSDEAKLTFERGPRLESPGFARALALFGVGEVSFGLAELRALGFLADGADPELAWLTVALLDRAGAPHLAVDLARRRMGALLSRAPRGRELALYRLVYPKAYAPLIEDTAGKAGVPSAFVRAVAREESGFYPRAVSRARARGLIQMLEPTARVVAKGLGLAFKPDDLSHPDVNLALGAHFISTLAGSLRGQFALVPVAYNAGPGVTSRWLSERPSEPLDVWIENIPYDETRHYTRRVLQSYGVYHWLETGELLELPLELPAI